MKIIFVFFLLIALALIFSCKDEITAPQNKAPQIESISKNPNTISPNETITFSCVATDEDGDNLTYTWAADKGEFKSATSSTSVRWKAPADIGTYQIGITVSDGKDTDYEYERVSIVSTNQLPELPQYLSPIDSSLNQALSIYLTWDCSDPDGDELTYDIYFGTNREPLIFANNQKNRTYNPGVLEYNTTYCWKIVAFDGKGGMKESEIWEFKTRERNGDIQLPQINWVLPLNNTIITETVEIVVEATDNIGITRVVFEVFENNNSQVIGEDTTPDGNNRYSITLNTKNIQIGNRNIYASAYDAAGNSEVAICKVTVINYETCPGIPTITYENKVYNTVQIGEQCWLKENLDVGIMTLHNYSNDNRIEKHCYENEIVNCEIYGALYQWEEAMQFSTESKTKGICPVGWHIPIYDDFRILFENVGENANALKGIDQGSGDGIGTNLSGFSCLLAGYISYIGDGDGWVNRSYRLHESTYYLTSDQSQSQINDEVISIPGFTYYSADRMEYKYRADNRNGYSVRCIKD